MRKVLKVDNDHPPIVICTGKSLRRSRGHFILQRSRQTCPNRKSFSAISIQVGCQCYCSLICALPTKFLSVFFDRFPFASNTVGGYSCALGTEIFIASIYLVVTITILSFFISISIHMRTFHSHYELLFCQIEEVKSCRTNSARIKIESSLIEAVKLHARAQE